MVVGLLSRGCEMVARLTLPSVVLLALSSVCSAATLEKLSVEEMIEKSTEIVRGRVVSLQGLRRGSVIYTVARIEIAEKLKGDQDKTIEVHVPGGAKGGVHQTFSGAPQLQTGSEYLLFLWTGRNKATQVIGLSQGLFELKRNADGRIEITREPAAATLLDSRTGREVADQRLTLPLDQVRARVRELVGDVR